MLTDRQRRKLEMQWRMGSNASHAAKITGIAYTVVSSGFMQFAALNVPRTKLRLVKSVKSPIPRKHPHRGPKPKPYTGPAIIGLQINPPTPAVGPDWIGIAIR